MPRRYNDVESMLLGEVRPGMVVVTRKHVQRVTQTAERVEILFDDGSSIAGPADAGLDVLSSTTDA